MNIKQKALLATAAMVTSAQAFAHAGHHESSNGFIAGVLHPITGTDHLLVLLAVGVMAAAIKGAQRLAIPLAFVALMALGYLVAYAGVQSIAATTIESLISFSLVAAVLLAVAISSGVTWFRAPQFGTASAWLITAFAVAHGFAHGLEVPAGASALGFASGFLMASAALIALSYRVTSVLKKRGLSNKVAN